MKNLENYGVQEISLNDQKNLSGGWWVALLRAAGAALAGDAVINYGSSWDALTEGYNGGQDANPF
jgi:hypothetical protein